MLKFAVVVFPGSNSDRDAWYAAGQVLGQQAELVWHKDTDLSGADAVILPGGFAHGDYLRTGAIARFSPIMARGHADLPNAAGRCSVSAMGSRCCSRRDCCPARWCAIAGSSSSLSTCTFASSMTDTPFTLACAAGQVLELPIAHGEGNYFAEPDVVAALEANRQVIFRYTDRAGIRTPAANPNGSINDIAGICNRTRNVVGLMPHPERACEPSLGSADGRFVLQSIVNTFAERVTHA